MGARRWVAGAGDGIAAMIATGPAIAGNVSLLRPELGAALGGLGLHTPGHGSLSPGLSRQQSLDQR